MSYTKATLRGSLEAVLADIKNIEYKGVKVYPDFPANYEFIGDSVFDRFVVTTPTQEAVMGDWECKVVLPSGYDTSHFNTIV